MASTSASSATAHPKALRASTIAEAFLATTDEFPDRVAFRELDDSVSISWGELRQRVAQLAGGLRELGVAKGDTVALMLTNRPEFHLADIAIVMAGATPVSLYQTFPVEQIEYVLRDSGAKVAIIEERYAEEFLPAAASIDELRHLIIVDGEVNSFSSSVIANPFTNIGNGKQAPDDLRSIHTLAEVQELNSSLDLEKAAGEISRDDLLTIIYTSGTTGPSKGVELTHRNIFTGTEAIREIIQFPDVCRVISWLPAAHIAERAAHHYLPIIYGMTVTCCPNPKEVMNYMAQVKPTWFFGVPRIWEKLKAGLEAMLAVQSDDEENKALAALEAAMTKVELEQAGKPVPAELKAAVEAADAELFSGLREYLGFGELVSVNVGAAPTPREVLVFFHAMGVPLSEIWGLSESTAAGTVNPPGRIKLGSVGPALPGVELKLASDGEILLRSDAVMAGYRNKPKETAEIIDAEGWLHTGDIGSFDEDGYLTIIDRKKDLIINSAGKNMSPSHIEGVIKGASGVIGQICVIGDSRPYNNALILLDPDFALPWAEQFGLEGKSLAEIAVDQRVIAAVQEIIDAANKKLARVEQIKKIRILSDEWLPGGEELTPTLKLRRKAITEKYADVIEALYS